MAKTKPPRKDGKQEAPKSGMTQDARRRAQAASAASARTFASRTQRRQAK
ncbi:MAG TPA: hypothetical protein PKD27_01700 [Tepidiformaceae bacterium]|nr:hypothetical protein [Tepidiformaceae bacterium]